MIGGIIRALDRGRFETFLVHAPGVQDDFTEVLNQEVSGAITLPNDLASARDAVSKLELDILFYADIGMDPFTYYLAFSRLARVQAVWPGHPITTGIPTIDAYISSVPAEPDNAQAHYSERLLCLQRLPIFGQPRRWKEGDMNFGFPPGKKIYACPNTVFKFHPTFDQLLGRVLKADPDGVFAIVGSRDGWYKVLIDRMSLVIPDFVNRLIVLPWLKKQEFFSLLRSVDAVLDTTHFSGGNTSLDGFSVGAAPVTLEGGFLRSRSTTGMYRQMCLPEFSAKTEGEYVDRAVRIANDPDLRFNTGREILHRVDRLFDDRLVIEELESYFAELVAAT